MIELFKLEPIARKLWTKTKWDEYINSRYYKKVKKSKDVYSEPSNAKFDDVISKPKWKSTVDKKVNYLLARKPILAKNQELLDSLFELLRDTAKEYIIAGSVKWIVQGDGVNVTPRPFIMTNTIAVYQDEGRQEPAAFIRKFVDVVVDPKSGAESTTEYFELYYIGEQGEMRRDTFCHDQSEADVLDEVLDSSTIIIEIGKTGDETLFAYVEGYLDAFNRTLLHQDKVTEKNTKGLVEVRGYSGTDDADMSYAVDTMGIVKTDGTGGVTVHARSMDSASIDLWQKRLLQEYYEATCTVGKENELLYAQSGKAMDRLFVDMENSARELAQLLGNALKSYFESIGLQDAEVIWNTDKPIDDTSIISGITQSRGLLSDKTLIEQHPWVDDVDEELRRKEEEANAGFEDFIPNDEEDL